LLDQITSVPDSWDEIVRQLPKPQISKQRKNRIERITLIRERREERQQRIGFSSRPFVLCGLPIRRPPPNELLYERRNGHFLLQITGHPHYGLPFGQDRLVPIFLATMAVQQQSQTVRFRSGAAMLETFGLAKGGKEYGRLVAAFERVFGATMFFGTDTQTTGASVIHRARFHFFNEAKIWFNRRDDEVDGISDPRTSSC
jgi:hypothetical protein